MKFLRKLDNMFDKILNKGGQVNFLGYLIKYLMTCGIGSNMIIIAIIAYYVFRT